MDSNQGITITSIPTPTLPKTAAQKDVIILPVSGSLKSGGHSYASTAISLKKYAEAQLEIDFLTPMDDLYDQRSSTIYLPTILFVAQALIENQELIRTTLDIITAFLKDSGKSESAPVELSCVVEETEGAQHQAGLQRTRQWAIHHWTRPERGSASWKVSFSALLHSPIREL